ncbi:DUF928 domain-containing protein [Calothrix sp. FACHB-1219]|uniref:DUF928 domain-containing protein n=1 Tax=unclassified Calothrix TaxID=2619626 RepID=UPI0016849283|nr:MULTISPECIES: DUF928 domain-containing protein [unclassified Calothrix]MBD2207420.1 DUF928 domain-containing protein [Calothrix sp. FACHB-168]MBD2221996.1 DUF928 domain-containing protein [Calothrix sp. FACHB-1219]
MNKTTTNQIILTLVILIVILTNFTILITEANAQTTARKSQRVTFTPPNRGKPKDRGVAGSRRGCPLIKQPLTALVPARDVNLTYSEHPTFLFNIPVLPVEARTGEFIVQDMQDNDIYRTSITLPEKAGIIKVKLPESGRSLSVNQTYQWYFKIYCQPQDKSIYYFVDGKVERVSRNNYSSENIWFDNLTDVAEKLRTSPQNPTVREEWTAFLQDGDLAEFANQPLLPCCSKE